MNGFMIFFFLFLFPATLILKVTGREEAKNLSGGNVLRLIQDPFSNAESDENCAGLSSQFGTNH